MSTANVCSYCNIPVSGCATKRRLVGSWWGLLCSACAKKYDDEPERNKCASCGATVDGRICDYRFTGIIMNPLCETCAREYDTHTTQT